MGSLIRILASLRRSVLLSDKKILFFHRNSIQGTLAFTASAHWAPFNFYKTTASNINFGCINFPCYLILKLYLNKRHLHLKDFHKGYKNPVIQNPSGGFHCKFYRLNTITSLYGMSNSFLRDSIYNSK